MTTPTEIRICEICNRTQAELDEMTGISRRYDGRMLCDTCTYVAWQAERLASTAFESISD